MNKIENEITKCKEKLPVDIINIVNKHALDFLNLDSMIELERKVDSDKVGEALKSEYVVWLNKQKDFQQAKEKLGIPIMSSNLIIKSMDEYRRLFFLEWMLARCLTIFTEEHAAQTVITLDQRKKIQELSKELAKAANGAIYMLTKSEQYTLNELLRKIQSSSETNALTYQRNRGNTYRNLLLNSLMRGIARVYDNALSATLLADVVLCISCILFDHKDIRRVTVRRAEMTIKEIEHESKM